LESKLQGINVGMYSREPLDEEEPPTLIAYPVWSKPIAGLFKILGAAAGYREFDVSAMFMLALPIFAAMLISDWGYSAVLVIVARLADRQLRESMGKEFLDLVRTIGVAGFFWGFLTDSCFGFAFLGQAIIPVNASKSSTDFLMFFSFSLGALHLLTAWLWQAWRLFPSLGMLSPLGWGLVVLGMYGLIQHLLLSEALVRFDLPFVPLLIIGAVLAIGFRDVRRPVRGILIGIADFPLSAIGKFGDVMSYVRLMAVGLAGSLLATSFNDMAAQAGAQAGIIPQILILIFAHSLNLALCCIAIFAHGVRLNMLEFSTNLGLTWSGRSFHPFTNHRID
jgi:V/A-type H+-transporting ATPase subunit I